MSSLASQRNRNLTHGLSLPRPLEPASHRATPGHAAPPERSRRPASCQLTPRKSGPSFDDAAYRLSLFLSWIWTSAGLGPTGALLLFVSASGKLISAVVVTNAD